MMRVGIFSAEAMAPGEKRVVAMKMPRAVDGAQHQLDLIRAEAARRKVTTHIVIDFVHAIEKIWACARDLHQPGGPAAEDWVNARALAPAGRTHRPGHHRPRRPGHRTAHPLHCPPTAADRSTQRSVA